MQPLCEALEVRLQVRCILSGRLTVHSDGGVLPGAPVRFTQPLDIDHMSQARERPLRMRSRQLRYPQEFRGDVLGAQGLRHLSLLRLRDSAAPSLHRVPWGRFPDFTGTMGGSDFRTSIPPRFVAFTQRYLGSVPAFAPLGHKTQWPWAWGMCQPAPRPGNSWRRHSDLPGSWGVLVSVPCSSTPTEPSARSVQRFGFAFRHLNSVDLRQFHTFGAQSHGPHTRCLRFTPGIAPRRARLASGWRSTLAGRDWLPAGLRRRFRRCRLRSSFPPSPGFAWRTQKVWKFGQAARLPVSSIASIPSLNVAPSATLESSG